MKDIVCGTLWIPYISMELRIIPTYLAQSIVCVDGKEFVAGALFDGYNGGTVSAHVLVKGRPLKEWFVYIFDYPFNVLKVRKIVGQVSSDNPKALEFDKSLGFVREATVSEFFENGAGLELLTMTREQCKILNDPKWAGLVARTRK